MKIEIDTKNDSKEELFHLASMLHALSRSKSCSDSNEVGVGSGTMSSKALRKMYKKGIVSEKNTSEENNFVSLGYGATQSDNNQGLFSLFSDSSAQTSPSKVSQADNFSSTDLMGGGDSQQVSSPSLFSMFGSDDGGVSEKSSVQNDSALPTLGALFAESDSGSSVQTAESTEESLSSELSKKFSSTAQDLLDDDRLVPY